MDSLRHTAKQLVLFTVLLISIAAVTAYSAGTPAGTVINCWTTATYTDESGTYEGSATSNVVSMTVGSKYDVNVNASKTSVAVAKGKSVVIGTTVKNNSNTSTTVSISSGCPAGWKTTVYADINADGIRQSDENYIVTTTPVLLADQPMNLLVQVDVPDTAAERTVGSVNLAATATADPSASASAQVSITVAPSQANVTLAANPANPSIGQEYTLTVTLVPQIQSAVSISALAPDGVQTSYVVNTDASGVGQLQMLADCTGDWVFSAHSIESNAQCTKTVNIAPLTYNSYGAEMVSFPLQLTNPTVESIYSNPMALALYRWDPATRQYGSYIPSNPAMRSPLISNLRLGQGFWLYSNGIQAVTPTGRLIDQNNFFGIEILAGWQQVGSPYLKPINWDDCVTVSGNSVIPVTEARAAGVMQDYAWTYGLEGSVPGYQLVHATMPGAKRTIDPWKGYWICSNTNTVLALVPGELGGGSSAAGQSSVDTSAETSSVLDIAGVQKARQQAKGTSPSGSEDWIVTLKSICVRNQDSCNYFGVSTDASLYGIINPPKAPSYEDLYFPYAVNGGELQFASDIRPSIGKTFTWKFEVASSDFTSVHNLAWDGMQSVPANVKLQLKDLQTKKVIDMRSTTRYPFKIPKANKTAKFQIIAKVN